MNTNVQKCLDDTMKKYDISQNQAAKAMGYSGAVLSAYMKGTYKGNIENLEDAAVKWVARTEQAHAHKKVPIIQTGDLKKMTNAIRRAHSDQDIALIVADAGSGKTTAAKCYQEENMRTTVLVNVFSGMNRKMLVIDIANQLGIDTTRVPLNLLISNVAAALSDRNMVVVIDEADYLKPDALEFTRRLVYDLGQSGLVLIGLPRLTAMIQNLRNDHRQLESRVGINLQLGGLQKPDAELIVHEVWPNAGKDIVDAIWDVSHTDIRQFTKIISRAENTMELNKLKEPDLDVIEVAAKLVMRRHWK